MQHPRWIPENGGSEGWFVVEIVRNPETGDQESRGYHGPFRKGQASATEAAPAGTTHPGRGRFYPPPPAVTPTRPAASPRATPHP